MNRGASKFNDQPHYTHFNKSFEDRTDAFYLLANEIDPVHLDQCNALHQNSAFDSQVVLDPRTQQEVPRTWYDHTKRSALRLFRSGTRSKLNKVEHIACLRVQRAWQEEDKVDVDDLRIWCSTKNKRQKEKQELIKYIWEAEQANKEQMYAPTKRLVELYKQWHSLRVQSLLQQHPQDVAYNTQAGLPHVRVCKDDGEQQAEIQAVTLLRREGWIPIWQEDKDTARCKSLKMKLDELARLCGETAGLLSPADDDTPQNNDCDKPERHRLIMPLESLLFLLTSGDYIDLPTEMAVRIGIIGDDTEAELKHVTFEAPLPARNCGWHTHQQVVEQLHAADQTLDTQTSWLHMTDEGVAVERAPLVAEINASAALQTEYKPIEFEEFLRNQPAVAPPQRRELRTNAALINWRLSRASDGSDTTAYDMYTRLKLPPALDDLGVRLLGCYCIKLEYKPEFGCELMTKYELLRKWWQIRLIDACLDAPSGKCLRIAVNTFEVQLEEQVTLLRIEQLLRKHYHMEMPKLLANLMEFLRLLLNMPAGEYLLRYNPKFHDKLLLCAPTKEITQNTVYLHTLLKAVPSDLAFMTQPNVLPIADDLCSRMHLYHQVLPCTFPPLLKHQKQRGGYRPATTAPTLLNDRSRVLERMRKNTEMRQQQIKNVKKHKKGAQKARRRKRQLHLKRKQQAEHTEGQELQREIERDQLMFGDA